MAIIDGFVSALFQFRGDGLLLESGQPAVLLSGPERRPITAHAPTHDQLIRILGEIAPAAALSTLSTHGQTSFAHDSPAGPIQVNVSAQNGLIRIHALPANKVAPLPEKELREAKPATPVARVALTKRPAADSAPAPRGAVNSSAPAMNLVPRPGAPEIESLLLTIVREGCSDLHLCSGNPPLYRLDGEIIQLGSPTVLSAERVDALLRGVLPQRNKEQFDVHHDADFAYEIPGVARFRCNVFVDRKGPGGVFRVIPAKIASAEDLGLSRAVMDFCDLPKGLVLVTGPTGSGKSTSLAAMIDYINRTKTAHLITIEDPIEFVHENRKCLVNQREVGPHTDGFKHALRAALREDPDIVLVGEMRDLETVAIAIETAETGHLVFGTLHTNTAASTVDRIIDQFPHGQQAQIRAMLSESLKGVISQTLCKKKGGGRVAAQEILVVTPSIANLIREGKTFQITSIMQAGKGAGMMTMNDALLDLVKKKIIEPEEAYLKSTQKTELRSAMSKLGFNLPEA